MENNHNIHHINPAIFVAILLQVIFIVFVVITIRGILNSDTGASKIEISNYSVISNGKTVREKGATSNIQDIDFTLSDTAKKTLESTIYDIVSNNNKGSILDRGAIIRENTVYYAYIEGLNAYLLHFIVDIEDLGQSYRFVWLFNDQENPKVELLMALCPKEDEMIYGGFNCKDDYNNRGLDIVAYNLIRHHSFENFSTELADVYEGNPLKITIKLPSGEEPPEEIAVQELSEYLSSLGFNLNDFKYEIVRLKPFVISR